MYLAGSCDGQLRTSLAGLPQRMLLDAVTSPVLPCAIIVSCLPVYQMPLVLVWLLSGNPSGCDVVRPHPRRPRPSAADRYESDLGRFRFKEQGKVCLVPCWGYLRLTFAPFLYAIRYGVRETECTVPSSGVLDMLPGVWAIKPRPPHTRYRTCTRPPGSPKVTPMGSVAVGNLFMCSGTVCAVEA